MTGIFLLDWTILAVSLFNTLLLLWLGLTVILNAERRTWGLWLAGGELLLGAAFFLSHTIILGHGLQWLSKSLDFWWRLGWVPVVTIPYVWYVIMLWYAGFWERKGTAIYRRHWGWFVGSTVLAVVTLVLILFANPLPSFIQVAQLNLTMTPSVGGVPLLILIYPLYIVLCMSLSVDVVRRPGLSDRIMGALARRRARPWLMGAAFAEVIVSLLVGGVMVWVILNARQRIFDPRMTLTVAWFDLVIAALISIAVLLVGQAVISYEVFTGKTLPRRGLFRYWRRAIILAGGYAVVISYGLTLPLHPVFVVLLSALLMTFFYALLGWRSYDERERYIQHLRPFLGGQKVYDQMLAESSDNVDFAIPFRTLCEEVLGTRKAYLTSLGPYATFASESLIYPPGASYPPPPLDEISTYWSSPEMICIPLRPEKSGDWAWVVPLWSERGMVGVLVLGDKIDGSLYTQEEIEIARTVGERLIDTQASVEMSRRLVILQRQRLVESQVLDQHARRVLHDDVLPQVHAALLSISSGEQTHHGAMEMLTDVHDTLSDLLRSMPKGVNTIIADKGLIHAMRHVLNEELAGAFDDVYWEINSQVEERISEMPQFLAEVIFYAAREAIRNAARHGRDLNSWLTLRISASHKNGFEMVIEDNGVGLESEKPTPSSGQGLALHTTMMAVIGGTMSLESTPGEYTRVVIRLPEDSWWGANDLSHITQPSN